MANFTFCRPEARTLLTTQPVAGHGGGPFEYAVTIQPASAGADPARVIDVSCRLSADTLDSEVLLRQIPHIDSARLCRTHQLAQVFRPLRPVEARAIGADATRLCACCDKVLG